MTMEVTPSTSVQTVHAGRSRLSAQAPHHSYNQQQPSLHPVCPSIDIISQPSSPHSGALPSPPDSPSSDSLSSFPSVSSSFFFSSGAASPHTQSSHPQSEHVTASDAGLIIPSLSLPPALPQPTPYGQTLGEVNLLLLGPVGADTTTLADFLMECDDIVDVEEWEEIEGAKILHASTDWLEERDLHGLERFEGTRNVSILHLDSFDTEDKPDEVAKKVLRYVNDVFHDVREQLDKCPPSPLLHSLLASSHSTLYTALIYATATPLTSQDHAIIAALTPSIPVVIFSTVPSSTALSFAFPARSQSQLSTFQPHSHSALRLGIFRSPQTLTTLRAESADRFMRWREVENTIQNIPASLLSQTHLSEKWDKAEWETALSEDMGRRIRNAQPVDGTTSENSDIIPHHPCYSSVMDPLHFRSIIMLSFSLLSPRSVKRRVLPNAMGGKHSELPDVLTSKSDAKTGTIWNAWKWGLIVVSALGAGVGIGLALSG